MPSHAKILVIDDEMDNLHLVTSVLEVSGYSNIQSICRSRDALEAVRQWEPDVILLDLMMPEMDGHQLISEIKTLLPADAFLPIIVLTADSNPPARERALSLGAHDFLTRPFEIFDLVLRVRNVLQTRFLHLELQHRNGDLESAVQQRTQQVEDAQWELQEAQLEIIERLGRCGEYRDEDTGLHTYRVAKHCRQIAQQLGLPLELVEYIRRAAPLHDVGKIGVSDTILLKPAKLTPEEFAIMKSHTTIGRRMLAGGNSELLQTAERIALSHHERWDGGGYPEGLKGEEIPIEARILAVADVFDALTHARPYKTAWSAEEAETEIIAQSGRQFDPDVVRAFCAVRRDGDLTA